MISSWSRAVLCNPVDLQHGVLSVEMRCFNSRDEELRSVGVGTSIRHGQKIRSVVLEREVLVIKAGSVDRLAACAVAVCEVTSLYDGQCKGSAFNDTEYKPGS